MPGPNPHTPNYRLPKLATDVRPRSKGKVYINFKCMHYRCYKTTDASYMYYGGRGIDVCSEWDSHDQFETDMEPTYFPGAQLDRIDNSKGYSKENCRWATPRQNQTNTRKTTRGTTGLPHIGYRSDRNMYKVSFSKGTKPYHLELRAFRKDLNEALHIRNTALPVLDRLLEGTDNTVIQARWKKFVAATTREYLKASIHKKISKTPKSGTTCKSARNRK